MKTNVLRQALLLGALVGFTASAPAAPPGDPDACPADDLYARPGLRAFIDPQTGQLREPTPGEAQAFSLGAREAFEQAVKDLQVVVHPDGTVSVDLKDLFMQDIVVVKGPGGALFVRCVPESERAVALATAAPVKPAALEER